MNDVAISSTAADASAVAAIEQHHAELAGALAARAEALLVAAGSGIRVDEARADLVGWALSELVPHAMAEEAALYPAGLAIPTARMLVEAMVVEHGVLRGLVEDLRTELVPTRAAAVAHALRVVFESHLTKENEQLLPVLAGAPGVELAGLLEEMHGHLVTGVVAAPAQTEAHDCTCGEHDAAGYPELDARAVPHAIRHATVFGALDAVRPGRGLVLVAPHDPLPLLAQLERRSPDTFEVSYLERGPEAWRLQLVRRSA